MHSNIALVVFVVVAILTTKSLGAVRDPPKGSIELPAKITTVKPSALPNKHSSHGNSAREQQPRKRADEGPEETALDYNARDRLDSAATYNTGAQLQGFGRVHAPVSMQYGYRPIIFSRRGFLTPESHFYLMPSASFPYFPSPFLYLGPCSSECEHFATHARNVFLPFHHITPTRALHDLAEYHGPHYNTAGFQPGAFRYTPLALKTQEQEGVSLAGGGQTRLSARARDVDHTKAAPHHLRDGINIQYRRQEFVI
ncbi:uncharacterized protein LOC111861687 isoform X1 [Cryptotermes secundus]|uniref:uncharacterized protein LOC111861687 isoform X1 n=1 Tax=Cryptotermes secundus TaxID=105785 RepID=UPI000CD7AE7B|nr:uncharacterized protein LOC111861687 isoform X1 [Cryptotermes secundus]